MSPIAPFQHTGFDVIAGIRVHQRFKETFLLG